MVWNTSAYQLLIISATGGFTGLFVYSGVPAHGNLIASIAPAAGTDPYGNAYQAGVFSYQGGGPGFSGLQAGSVLLGLTGINTADAALTTSGSPGSNAQLFIHSGHAGEAGAAESQLILNDSGLTFPSVQALHSADGVTYPVGQNTYYNGTAVTIPASGFQTVTAGQNVVSGGTYLFDGIFRLKQGAIGSTPGNVGFTMPAVSFGVWYAAWQLQGALTTFNSQNTVNLPTQINILGAQTVANDEAWGWYKGVAVFSAGGTFQFGCQADGTHSFTAQPGCIFTVRRVA